MTRSIFSVAYLRRSIIMPSKSEKQLYSVFGVDIQQAIWNLAINQELFTGICDATYNLFL